MDNASADMMQKFWGEWLATLSRMQGAASQSMAGGAREAADVADRGGSAGAANPMAFFTPEAARQFQQAFLDTMAHHCDQYMRSPQFLEMMKQSMDRALTFRQEVNEFLNRAMASGMTPPAAIPPDQAVIVDAVRETERKLRDHLDALGKRIDRLERTVERLNGAAQGPDASAGDEDDEGSGDRQA